MTDLAKRAVACKGWRWVPGMLTLPWRDEFGDVSHPPWRLRTENWMPFADGHRGAIPDLTDPATLGCLLALVREAHDMPCLHTQWDDDLECWFMSELCGEGEDVEAAALVAALELADG